MKTKSIYGDHKVFFHYHRMIHERYGVFLKSDHVVNDLMVAAKPIWETAKDTVGQIFAVFESEFPKLAKRFFDAKESEILLRFLKYEG